MFTDPQAIAIMTEKAPVVCFSATNSESELDKLESSVVESLGFTQFNYWPKGIP